MKPIYGCHNKINKEEKKNKQVISFVSFSSQLDAKNKNRIKLTSEEIYFIISKKKKKKKQDNDYYKSDI
jgi:hypothetical protein